MSAPIPTYPIGSRRGGEEGKVMLRVKVLANGGISNISIKTSSGFPLLDVAALESLKTAKFVPAKTISGDFVDSWVIVPITFKLGDSR